MFVIIAILAVTIIVPVIILNHETNSESGNVARPSARIRLHYTQNPITSEIMRNENIAARYTFAFVSDGTSVNEPTNSSRIAWTNLILVFDHPTTATNLRINFEAGGSLIYQPVKIESRLAVIRFDGSLADKILDIEFN